MPVFKRRIVRPGHYRVRGKDGKPRREYINRQRIKGWVDKFNEMKSLNFRIPAPWRHDPKAVPVRFEGDEQDIDAFNNAGFWQRLWQDKNGELWGEVDVPNADNAEKVGTSVQDVSLLAKPRWGDSESDKEWEDALTHIALVTHPVAKDGDNFEQVAEEGVALSLEQLAMADDSSSESETPVNASSVTVKDLLKQLRELDPPIDLPDDTSAENFLERLVTAIKAIKATSEKNEEGDTVREPGSGSKEQPGPVAMSKNTELKLSNEDQAAIDWAKDVARNSYKGRIETLVKTGRITATYAKEHLAPLLPELALSFNDEGKPVPNVLDTLLTPLEALPANTVLTGKSRTAATKSKSSIFGGASEVAFSIDIGEEQEPPEDPNDEFAEPTEEDADKLADQILAGSGMVEGRDYDKH